MMVLDLGNLDLGKTNFVGLPSNVTDVMLYALPYFGFQLRFDRRY